MHGRPEKAQEEFKCMRLQEKPHPYQQGGSSECHLSHHFRTKESHLRGDICLWIDTCFGPFSCFSVQTIVKDLWLFSASSGFVKVMTSPVYFLKSAPTLTPRWILPPEIIKNLLLDFREDSGVLGVGGWYPHCITYGISWSREVMFFLG